MHSFLLRLDTMRFNSFSQLKIITTISEFLHYFTSLTREKERERREGEGQEWESVRRRLTEEELKTQI
jgi:hypothetical protein